MTLVQVAPPRFVHRTFEIGQPQLFVDDYLVDNRFNEDLLSARVAHVLHPPVRVPQPVLAPDAAHPWEWGGLTWPSVVYDPQARLYRMYYQVYQRFFDRTRYPDGYPVLPSERGPAGGRPGGPGYPPGKYVTGYAESADGLHWERPPLGRFGWGPHRETNIVLQGRHEAFTPHVHLDERLAGGASEARDRTLGLLPPDAFRGRRFLMFYGDRSHYLAASDDGLHWEERVQRVFDRRSDAFHTLTYDETRREYVSYLRNTNVFGGHADGRWGNVRMIARLASPDLWSEWDRESVPSTVLLPDAGDADRYYGMPVFRYGGVYWGFLQALHEDERRSRPELSASRDGGEWGGAGGAAGIIDCELAFSRDGITWQRLAGRPKILPAGEPGAWDGGMIFGPDRVIERGDEWWLYYNGWHGPHYAPSGPGPAEKLGAIGLARARKEGFVSIRADAAGRRSYVVTRPLLWPGGDLLLNADARGGYVAARVTDVAWDEVPGFGFADAPRFAGDAVRHRVRWGDRSLAELTGRYVRLELEFVRADLFAFAAGPRA
jgi:hypothetical protein